MLIINKVSTDSTTHCLLTKGKSLSFRKNSQNATILVKLWCSHNPSAALLGFTSCEMLQHYVLLLRSYICPRRVHHRASISEISHLLSNSVFLVPQPPGFPFPKTWKKNNKIQWMPPLILQEVTRSSKIWQLQCCILKRVTHGNGSLLFLFYFFFHSLLLLGVC